MWPAVLGRPRGSRNALSEEVICALLRDFRQHGQKAVARVRQTQPAAYLKILALLIPREHKVEHSNLLKELSDEQLEAMIEYIETSLAAQAGAPAKMIEGMIEPTTVPATALPVLEPPKRKPNRLMMEVDTSASRGSACHRLLAPDLTMSGRDIALAGRVYRRARPLHMLDCAVRRSLMPPDINHWDATGLVYTVQKTCINFLVSFNGAEFPMRNQRRNASPPTT